MATEKKCTKCGEMKSLGEFYKNRNACKVCERARKRKWQKENPEKERERNRRWHKENPERVRERNRSWRKENPEKVREYRRKFENLGKAREYRQKWRKENPEKVQEYRERWQRENREKVRAKRRKSKRTYRARKFGHRIPSEAPHWSIIGPRDNWTCHICGEPVQKHWNGPHSRAPTVDHITPISLGGADTFDNVKLAHFGCNASRGNKPLGEIAAE